MSSKEESEVCVKSDTNDYEKENTEEEIQDPDDGEESVQKKEEEAIKNEGDEKEYFNCELGRAGIKINEVQNTDNIYRKEAIGPKIEYMNAFANCQKEKGEEKSIFDIPDKSTSNIRWKDPCRSELHYYLSTLRLAIPNMSSDQDKMKLRRWVFYLLKNVNDKTVRNRYLLLVTISALADECMSVVKEEPPSPIQRCVPSLYDCCYKSTPARWESDLYWDRLVEGVPCNKIRCPLHKSCIPNVGVEEGVIEAVGGHLMDQEFKYFLFLITSYINGIKCPIEKMRISMWIQTLGSILPDSCAFMKGLRNDYMQALLGYVSVGKSPGPFKRFPPDSNILLPLAMEVKKYCNQPELAELSLEADDEILSSQQEIENGAFCFIALSGNNNNSSLFNSLNTDL